MDRPLPPYIRRGREGPGDRLRYQTVYARVPGAVAAPTAGLHFTDDVFRRLAERGIACVDATLHVGLGTFRPIQAERIEDHVLHAEWAELSAPAVATLNAHRARGGRVVAVGTTSARVLESAALASAADPREPRPVRALRGGDRPLPPPRPRLPRPRRPAHQLPPPPQQPARPRRRPGRRRPDPRGLRRGRPPTLPLLQLRRRDADPLIKGGRWCLNGVERPAS